MTWSSGFISFNNDVTIFTQFFGTAKAMMLHNGVDPTQTEGMSKGVHRSEGAVGFHTC